MTAFSPSTVVLISMAHKSKYVLFVPSQKKVCWPLSDHCSAGLSLKCKQHILYAQYTMGIAINWCLLFYIEYNEWVRMSKAEKWRQNEGTPGLTYQGVEYRGKVMGWGKTDVFIHLIWSGALVKESPRNWRSQSSHELLIYLANNYWDYAEYQALISAPAW